MPLQAPEEPKKYTTVYSDFRGVDYTNDQTNIWKRRSPTGHNMLPDEAGRPWKRTGWEIALSQRDFQHAYDEVVNDGVIIDKYEIIEVHSVTIAGKEHLIINTTVAVFDYTVEGLRVLKLYSVDYGRTFYFESGATEGLYLYKGTTIYKFDGETLQEIEPYVPTIIISRDPSGGGTLQDPVNLLGEYRIEEFLGNDTSTDYYVSTIIDRERPVKVEVKNSLGIYEELLSGYTVEPWGIRFESAKPPVVPGEDNVRITYARIGGTDETATETEMCDIANIVAVNGEDLLVGKVVKLRTTIESGTLYNNGVPQITVQLLRDAQYGDLNLVYGEDYTVTQMSNGRVVVEVQFNVEKYENIFPTGKIRPYVKITYMYRKASSVPAVDAFSKCRKYTIYGTGLANSVFMSASTLEGFKSRVWYSKVGDPTYFPDINYFEAGSNNTEIVGLVKVGEYLGVIKQGDSEDVSIYLAYPISFDENTAYAVKQSVNGIGAVSINGFNTLGDELLFFSKEGIMAVDVTANENERKLRNRSYYLNKKLLAEENLELAVSYVWNGFYFLCVNSHCYILDGAQKTSWANERTNLQYEGYYWDNIDAKCFAQFSDSLWFADSKGNMCRMKKYEEDGILAYNDNGEAIPCEWSTILDNDGATNYFKNLQKKGCLVTLLPLPQTGAEVYVRADGKEPELIGKVSAENPTVPIEFYLNKKVKKYKRLQIIVRNNNINQGFGLQEIIKVYTVGNYSKNRG